MLDGIHLLEVALTIVALSFSSIVHEKGKDKGKLMGWHCQSLGETLDYVRG